MSVYDRQAFGVRRTCPSVHNFKVEYFWSYSGHILVNFNVSSLGGGLTAQIVSKLCFPWQQIPPIDLQ